MAYLEWQDSLNTGISVIDGQHKRIVKYINELHEAKVKGNYNKSKIDNIVIQLIDYTVSHFAFEESLIIEAGFEQAQAHKQNHKSFSNQILKFKQQNANGEDIVDSLLKLLHDWLYIHIQKEDAQYVEAVNKHFS